MTRDPVSARGFAILIVLWTLALLSLLSSQLLMFTRQDARRVRSQLDAAAVAAAVDGALQRAIFATLDPSGGHWQADSSSHVLTINGTRVATRIDDESGKINPNLAPVPLLRALMTGVGADPAMAAEVSASIDEWRAVSDFATRPGNAALRYRAEGRAYAPSGAPFAHLDELGAVRGMTPELLARLKPHLTLFTDIDVAPASSDPIVARTLEANQ